MKMHAVVFCLAACLPLAAFAETVRIDMVAFIQADANAGVKEENWKTAQDLKLDLPGNLVPLKFSPNFDEGYTASATEQSEALSANLKRGNYRIIAAYSWFQPRPANGSALAVYLQGGQRYGDHYELEGSLTLSQGENLTLTPELWLSSFTKRNTAVNDPLPANPIIAQERTQQSTEAPAGAADQPALSAPAVFYEAIQILELNEKRETKLGELNYFDHPVFGILIRVSTPDALSE